MPVGVLSVILFDFWLEGVLIYNMLNGVLLVLATIDWDHVQGLVRLLV